MVWNECGRPYLRILCFERHPSVHIIFRGIRTHRASHRITLFRLPTWLTQTLGFGFPYPTKVSCPVRPFCFCFADEEYSLVYCSCSQVYASPGNYGWLILLHHRKSDGSDGNRKRRHRVCGTVFFFLNAARHMQQVRRSLGTCCRPPSESCGFAMGSVLAISSVKVVCKSRHKRHPRHQSQQYLGLGVGY